MPVDLPSIPITEAFPAAVETSHLELTAEDRERKRQQLAGGVLTQARRQFHTSANAESQLRLRQLDDYKFWAGEQWPKEIESLRALERRPCLTINRLQQFTRLVTNQMRQSRPSVVVHPVGGEADQKTAEVFQGLIRDVETQSDAQVAYATAMEHQAIMGRGWWRVDIEYSDTETFLQEIRIRRVRNPFTIYIDPACVEADYSDARFAFEVEDVPKDEFLARFPHATPSSLETFKTLGDFGPDWNPEGKVRIAKYWWVEQERTRMLLVEGPDKFRTEVLQDEYLLLPELLRTLLRVIDHRQVNKRQVKCALINGVEILEGNHDRTDGRDWPGKWIPIVAVLGDEIEYDGQLDLRGMVRAAKDPQRQYNYWVSSATETVALGPRAPWVAAEGQIEDYEDEWEEANVRNFSVLHYKPTTVEGIGMVPPPQRNVAEAPIQGQVMAVRQANMDLQNVMGLYEPSLGQRKSDESGKAIQALQRQGEMGSSNYLDNLARAIRFTGRILIDLIPKVYDLPRVVRILGVDEKPQKVAVHAGTLPTEDVSGNPLQPSQALMASLSVHQRNLMEGIQGIYDLSAGRYDVTTSVGQSFATRRQEEQKLLFDMIQSAPEIRQVAADLAFESLDSSYGLQIAQRIRKMMPGHLLENPDLAAFPAEAQQMIQQLQTQLEQHQQQLQQAQQVLQTKQIETQGKNQAGVAIAQIDAQTELQQTAMEVAGAERVQGLKAQTELAKMAAKAASDRELAVLKGQIQALVDRIGHLEAKELRHLDHAFAQDRESMLVGEGR